MYRPGIFKIIIYNYEKIFLIQSVQTFDLECCTDYRSDSERSVRNSFERVESEYILQAIFTKGNIRINSGFYTIEILSTAVL